MKKGNYYSAVLGTDSTKLVAAAGPELELVQFEIALLAFAIALMLLMLEECDSLVVLLELLRLLARKVEHY